MNDTKDIQLFCSDCMNYLSKMNDKTVDCTITDIPYGEVNRESHGLRNLDVKDADITTFSLEKFTDEICRVTSGSIYIFCGISQVSAIRAIMLKNKMITRLCIWKKTNPCPMNGKSVWLSGIECCVYGKFKGATFNENCKNTVFEHPIVRGKLHPTQKPVKLLEYFIKASTNEGDVVLDPCMGSGSTGVACIHTNRKFIGIELNKEYFKKASIRLLSSDVD